ncbi:hypothetical protein BDZ90DRAFT_230878 [Jaminaea rosea]|uniref:Homeobox domain-containing protein n=1 Tax=Jaminaea rosea TaxID=1569628 RepID=A0A316UU87_9BASI|nr:hypothetical protein BDZ90DRAFT_230878 [Jaminaea rosea]PWN28870.1 hypothetical protein BDZ90DRAFT_230878 [Jaminaea rosea]
MAGTLAATPSRADAGTSRPHLNGGNSGEGRHAATHLSTIASRRDEENNPPSDDSISAYINHSTSSPLDAGSRPSQEAKAQDEDARVPSSPSPTPADDEDVAAASGMLSLRASQDSSASRPARVLSDAWRLPPPDSTAAHQDAFGTGRPSDFFIHRDDDDNNVPTSMRLGARDAVLYGLGASSPASHLPRSGSGAHPHRDRESTTVAEEGEGEGEDEDEELDELQDPNASQSFDSSRGDDDDSREYDTSTGPDGKPKKRRRRTKKEEADVLVSVYAQTAFPDSATRQRLASQLGMTTRAISIWFQNRRQAERKRASRFGPAYSAAEILVSSQSSNTTAPSRSISLGSGHHTLQRWPSLDAIAASQGTESRAESPASEHDGQGLASLRDPSASFEVHEDKENISLPSTQSAPTAVERKGDRQRLRDIRDLVFGLDALKPPQCEGTDTTEGDENDASVLDTTRANFAGRSPWGRSVSSSAALCRPSMEQVVGRSRARHHHSPHHRHGSGAKANLLRFMSLSTSRRGRASLDGQASPPAKRPFLRSLSERGKQLPPTLAKAIHLSERAEEHSAALHEQREEQRDLLAKMSSSSSMSSGEEGAATRLPICGEEEDEEQTLRRAANRRLVKAQAAGKELPDRSDAINSLRSRPWARSISGPVCGAATLDLAAGRDRTKPSPLAFVQRPQSPPVQSQQDMFALPNAVVKKQPTQSKAGKKRKSDEGPRSVGGSGKKNQLAGQDASLVSAASLGQENLPPTPLPHQQYHPHASPSPRHFGATGTPHLVKQHSFVSPKGLPSFGTPRSELGKSRSFGRSISAQSTLPSQLGGITEESPSSARNGAPSSSWAPSSMGGVSLYSTNGTSATPASHLHRPSMQGSASREMTPRSLAFALGLAHATPGAGHGSNSNGVSGAGGAGGLGSLFMSSSRYSTSRYLASSSRDSIAAAGGMPGSVRASGGAAGGIGAAAGAPYSPLARGRQGAMLYAAPTPRTGADTPARHHSSGQPMSAIGGEKRNSSSSGSSNGSRGSSEDQEQRNKADPQTAAPPSSTPRTGGRVPFSKVHSQPSMPPPPLFSANGTQSSSQPQRRVQRLPSLSTLATAAGDTEMNKENESGLTGPSPGLLPLGALKSRTSNAASKHPRQEDVGDDSGFAAPLSSASDNEDDGEGQQRYQKAGKVVLQSSANGNGSGGSPTRQRQHDAAQVLLGLAGEGR